MRPSLVRNGFSMLMWRWSTPVVSFRGERPPLIVPWLLPGVRQITHRRTGGREASPTSVADGPAPAVGDNSCYRLATSSSGLDRSQPVSPSAGLIV